MKNTMAKLETVRNFIFIFPPEKLYWNVRFYEHNQVMKERGLPNYVKPKLFRDMLFILLSYIDSYQKNFQPHSARMLRKYFLGNLAGNVERRTIGFDDKVPVGQAIKLLTAIEKLLGRTLISRERPFFLGKAYIIPTVGKR